MFRSPRALLLAALAPLAAHAQPAPGGASTRIDLDSVDLAAVSTLSELLQARVPGLLVRSQSGSAGASAEVLSRGRKAYLGSAAPLLVVDGVRAVATPRALALDAGQSVSRLDDIPLEQIATVEVLPGPAAAARFGAGASSGAILVTTRRARPGAPMRRVFAEGGASLVPSYRLAGVVGFRASPTTGQPPELCLNVSCAQVVLQPFDPLADAPIAAAPRWRAGAAADGGSRTFGWSSSADAERTGGVLAGNAAERVGARVNADVRPTDRLTLRAGVGGTDRRVALRPYDLASVARSVFVSDPAHAAPDETPISQRARRLDASLAADWRAASWLGVNVALGTSVVRARETVPPTLSDGAAAGTAWRQELHGDDHERLTTAAASATASRSMGPLRTATTIGLERVSGRSRFRAVRSTTNASFPTLAADDESLLEATSRSTAVVGAQRLELGPLAADVVLRDERGDDLLRSRRHVTDGSVSLLWHAVRHSALALDLRAAGGDVRDPLLPDRELLTIQWAPAVAGAIPQRPRTREGELSAELSVRGVVTGRAAVYRQRTTGVGVPRYAAPALGYSAMVLGAADVGNDGLEATLRARLVDAPRLGLTLGLQAWGNRNRVLAFDAPSIPMGRGDGTHRVVQPGRPLVAYSTQPIVGFSDTNGDGVLAASEVQVDHGRAAYAGTTDAPRAGALDAALRVGRHVTARALLEHRGGTLGTGANAAAQIGAARAAYDPRTPLEEQARYVTWQQTNALTLQDATFTRLRELSLAAPLPFLWGGARAATFTVAARNLATWTRYSGSDPEVEQAVTRGVGSAYAQPLSPTLVVRLGATW
jgi:hypothetical protein